MWGDGVRGVYQNAHDAKTALRKIFTKNSTRLYRLTLLCLEVATHGLG